MINKLRIPVVIIMALIMVLAFAEVFYCGDGIVKEMHDEAESDEYYKRMAQSFHEQDDSAGDQIILTAKSSTSPFNFCLTGWLCIDDTCIDYPVMQEGDDQKGFYLDHRADGNPSGSGCLYIPAGDSVDSDNVIIYGHHMRNGSMFAALSGYKDRDWALSHRQINLITQEGVRRYDVIAVVVESTRNRIFKWDEYIDFASADECTGYGVRAQQRSVTRINEGVITPPGDAGYLTLVTCDYSVPDGRLAVIAVLCE